MGWTILQMEVAQQKRHILQHSLQGDQSKLFEMLNCQPPVLFRATTLKRDLHKTRLLSPCKVSNPTDKGHRVVEHYLLKSFETLEWTPLYVVLVGHEYSCNKITETSWVNIRFTGAKTAEIAATANKSLLLKEPTSTAHGASRFRSPNSTSWFLSLSGRP